MPLDFESRCKALVVDLGLAKASDAIAVQPLSGGVASDIARVDVGASRYCVKFALEKLKVAEDWRAPVHRNRAEYAWLSAVAAIVPESVPALFGRSDRENGFAMAFLDGAEVVLWKDKLLHGQPDIADAEAVGDVLGRIHAASAAPGFARGAFHNRDDFRALRLEPYLTFTARRHPDLADRLNGLADALYRADAVMIHGDVSPKNILFRRGTPVLLDAECATLGDPCFDLAFCLNHLMLKSIHRPDHAGTLRNSARALWAAYAPHVDWETAKALEARVAGLLPELMLARVDGKSPVEYLGDAARVVVRDVARAGLLDPSETIDSLISRLPVE